MSAPSLLRPAIVLPFALTAAQRGNEALAELAVAGTATAGAAAGGGADSLAFCIAAAAYRSSSLLRVE